jgi:hypothetical protein
LGGIVGGLILSLLGIPGDNTSANCREANRAFYRLTVLPLVRRTAKDLSNWLSPLFGDDPRLGYDTDQVEGLAADRDALWARIGAADFLSDAEKREAVGYGPRDRFSSKAGYRPEQPRVPAGNADGGQWTDGGGTHDVADMRTLHDDPEKKYTVNLQEEESPKGIGHTIRDHVEKSDADLLANLEAKSFRGWLYDYVDGQEGSFESLERANDLTNRVLLMNKAIVDRVASGEQSEAYIEVRFGYATGREVRRTKDHPTPYFRRTYSVGVYIVHDSRSPRGYYVVTSFPRNRGRDDEL